MSVILKKYPVSNTYTTSSDDKALYEEYQGTITITGNLSAGQSLPYVIIKNGSRMSLFIKENTLTITAGGVIESIGTLPERFRPATISGIHAPMMVENGGTKQWGMIKITVFGTIEFYPTSNTATAWTVGAAKTYGTSINYIK